MRTPSLLEAAIMHRRLAASTSFVLGCAASGSACGRSRLTPSRSGAAAGHRGTTGEESISGHKTVGRVESQPPPNPGRSSGVDARVHPHRRALSDRFAGTVAAETIERYVVHSYTTRGAPPDRDRPEPDQARKISDELHASGPNPLNHILRTNPASEGTVTP